MTHFTPLTEAEIAALRLERLARARDDRAINENAPPIAHVEDVVAPAGTGVRCRLYLPVRHRSLPLLIYAHGGGWAFGSLDSHDRLLRQLAISCEIAVLSVDYRLSPEHPFPAARDDLIAVVHTIRARRCLLNNLKAGSLFVGGDSAGAHIALSAALQLEPGTIDGAFLFYGAFRPGFTATSHASFGSGEFGLSTADMKRYWAAYLHSASHHICEKANLLAQDLHNLPNMYIEAAQLDPLLSDSLELAEALRCLHVTCECTVSNGMHHGYLRHFETTIEARVHFRRLTGFLKSCAAGSR
ncbi:alpha/beta hydrolase [Chelatococcus asaccharovorans]|uniref:alpha/beta hydrolase n=1 Tax=Chelatococcus asaccharovorans TaxID=28210 RepID=UPI00224C64A5|nr:alpha/beta hydrolase [Chelatococcus asaccharovorans]CAH1660873.1 Acetyl esterase [Chelatococcus asaccharovorans]CAH1683639.1 Acetyl esterase [Chelatococcus asaccharovorans]